jgi:hypothetical protein
MRIDVSREVKPEKLLRANEVHPLALLRPISPRARELFITNTPLHMKAMTSRYAGFRGACLSSVESLITRGIIETSHPGKTTPGALFMYPEKNLLHDNNRESLLHGDGVHDHYDRALSYAATSEQQDRLIRWAQIRCSQAGIKITGEQATKIFDILDEFSDLSEFYDVEQVTKGKKRILEAQIRHLGNNADVYLAFDQLHERVDHHRGKGLGFIIFLRHSILNSFPLIDAGRDEGLYLHAPRGVGIEHVAGVVRADGRPITSLKELMREALDYF